MILYKHIAECCDSEVWVTWRGHNQNGTAPCCPECGQVKDVGPTDIQIEVNEQ